MSTGAGIAAMAAANSAAAAAAARAAHVAACRSQVKGYQHDTATVQQRMDYADCIDLLYPREIAGGEAVALKIFVAILMVGFAVGAVNGWRECFASSIGLGTKATDAFMGGLMGLVMTTVLVGAGVGLFFGVRFLLS